jgi:hypothetical protein
VVPALPSEFESSTNTYNIEETADDSAIGRRLDSSFWYGKENGCACEACPDSATQGLLGSCEFCPAVPSYSKTHGDARQKDSDTIPITGVSVNDSVTYIYIYLPGV